MDVKYFFYNNFRLKDDLRINFAIQ